MTDYSHIAPQFRSVMERSDVERIEFLNEARWIEYRAGSKLLELLQSLLFKPPRPRMQNLVIVGDSNSGKTTLIDRFRTTTGQPYISDDGVSVRPVIYAEIHKPNEQELFSAILDGFWAPHNPAAPLPKLRHQAMHLIRSARTRMLIIDEAHTIMNGSPAQVINLLNELKMLANKLQIPLVLVGTRLAAKLMDLDPQYSSRFEVISLPNWAVDVDFQRFLKTFESVLPLKKPSKLYSPDLATLIHAISDGVTGNVEYLLQECAKEAIQSGAEVIDRALLERNKWMRPTNGKRERTL